jgi:outer membrane protein
MRKFITIIIVILGLSSGLYAQEGKVWTLEECISYALDQNIDVRKTGLSILSNEELALRAKAGRLPSLNASVSQSFNWRRATTMDTLTQIRKYGSFEGENGTNYGVNSNVTLFNGGRLNNEIKQSDLSILGSKYNLETIKESVSLSILNAFLQVLYAEELVRNTEKQIESTAGQLNLATERLNLRIISQSDFLQVKSQLASEKLSLVNAQS